MSEIFYDQIPPETGRKYSITANPDGTSSITDVTQYIQEGTPWSAADANAMMAKAETVTYTATVTTSWSGSGPYTQNVAVSGLLSTDNPIVGPVLSATLETRQAQQEAWNMVSRITTSSNTLSLTCDEDKPTVAIPIQIMVVR